MFTKIVAGLFAITATLVALPSSAPLAASPAAAPVPALGSASGAWSLPSPPSERGHVEGLMRDAAGNTLFRIDGSVTEAPTPALAIRIGSFQADLEDGSTAAWPRFRLYGEWTAVSLIGVGVFDAWVTVQFSPLSAVFPIGTLKGRFADVPNTFDATWRANL